MNYIKLVEENGFDIIAKLVRHNPQYSTLLYENTLLNSDIISIIHDYSMDVYNVKCAYAAYNRNIMVFDTNQMLYFDMYIYTNGYAWPAFSMMNPNVIKYKLVNLPGYGEKWYNIKDFVAHYRKNEEKVIQDELIRDIWNNRSNIFSLSLFFNHYMSKYYGKKQTYIQPSYNYKLHQKTVTYCKKRNLYIMRLYKVFRQKYISCQYLLVRIGDHRKLKEMIICMKLLCDRYLMS